MGNCLTVPLDHSTDPPSQQNTADAAPPAPAPAPRPKNRKKSRTSEIVTASSSSARPNLNSPRGSIRLGSSAGMLDALRNYATLPSPDRSLPANKLLLSNTNTIVIFDAYPKAKYHFLVLPRYPFPPQSDPESRESIVKLSQLDDLTTLLTSTNRDVREHVIRSMAETAREVEEMVRDEMIKTEGFEWRIDVGFHAIPSMNHLHLHVISEDRISPSMKTKKHHNSFRPDLGFFISIMDVLRWLELSDSEIRHRANGLASADGLLNAPLACFKCDEPFSNIPKLKAHLEEEFTKEKKRALNNIKKHGRQGGSDEGNIF